MEQIKVKISSEPDIKVQIDGTRGDIAGGGSFAPIDHTHSISDVTGLQTALNEKAGIIHNHDDRYYTETEINTLLNNKANKGSNSDITSMNGITGGISTPDFIDFDTTATNTDAVARMKWNETDGTLDLGLKGGNVTLQIGQEQVQMVLNKTGTPLYNGQAVYITGSQGNRLTVALANANAESTSSKTFGILTENINNNQSGFITTSGLVRDIDTSALTEGSAVYLSPLVPGGLTTTKPIAPNHLVLMGWCVRQHATVGAIFVHIINGYELDELHDVLISGKIDKQVLSFDNASGLWKNKTLEIADINGLQTALDNTSSSAHNHDDRYYTETETNTLLAGKANTNHNHTTSNITDFTTASNSLIDTAIVAHKAETDPHPQYLTPAEGNVAYSPVGHTHSYTALTDKPTIPTTLGTLTNVSLNSVTNGQVLKWDSTIQKWVNATDETNAGLAVALNDLSDVTIGTLSNGQLIRYNTTTSQWENWTPNYSVNGHTHDDRYYTETETNTLLAGKANTTHTHTITDITNLQTVLDNKANTVHTHDDRYYTETEIDTKLDNKSDVGHTHDDRYFTETETSTLISEMATTITNETQTALAGKADSNHTHTLDNLSDVVVSTPASGQILKFNGTNWVNGDNTGGSGGGASTLDDLTDVAISTPLAGQVVKYDGSTWVNGEQAPGNGNIYNLRVANFLDDPKVFRLTADRRGSYYPDNFNSFVGSGTSNYYTRGYSQYFDYLNNLRSTVTNARLPYWWNASLSSNVYNPDYRCLSSDSTNYGKLSFAIIGKGIGGYTTYDGGSYQQFTYDEENGNMDNLFANHSTAFGDTDPNYGTCETGYYFKAIWGFDEVKVGYQTVFCGISTPESEYGTYSEWYDTHTGIFQMNNYPQVNPFNTHLYIGFSAELTDTHLYFVHRGTDGIKYRTILNNFPISNYTHYKVEVYAESDNLGVIHAKITNILNGASFETTVQSLLTGGTVPTIKRPVWPVFAYNNLGRSSYKDINGVIHEDTSTGNYHLSFGISEFLFTNEYSSLSLYGGQSDTIDLQITSLNQLSDVDTSTSTNNQVLTNVNGTWVGTTPVSDLDSLTDTVITNTVTKNVLYFNGTNWVNKLLDYTDIDGGVDLYNLTDVSITNPTNNQYLKYNETTGKWVNVDFPTLTTDLSNLNDVSVSNIQTGQVLMYNATLQEWYNATIQLITDLNGLSDVTITNPTNGQTLVYNGGQWYNGNISMNIWNLQDVDFNNVSDGQVLTYDEATDKWINKDPTGGGTTTGGDLGQTFLLMGA